MKNRYKRKSPKAVAKKGWGRRAAAGLAVLAVSGLLAGLAYGIPWAAGKAYDKAAGLDVFEVTEVQVSGLKHVRKDDLVSYMGDPTGSSIIEVDVDALVESLKAHPWIKSVCVKRELPGRLRLTVEERTPAVRVDARAGRYLADGEGMVLASVDSKDWDYLPAVVYETADRPPAPGTGPDEGIAMAIGLLGPVRSDATETLAGAVIYAGRDGIPYLRLDGAVVTVGRGGYEDKVRRLAEIFGDVRRRGISPRTIDLRFPGKVIVDGEKPGVEVTKGNS